MGDKHYRNINELAQEIRRAKAKGYNINLLIGAGCSYTSGIPTALGIVERIAKEYKSEYLRCQDRKSYSECMSKLTPIERRNLIGEYVSSSKVNWAHLSIAQLFKKGYINRVLTTNFDNLVVRACALVNEFPAIYDLTTSTQGFRTDLLFDKSVIYLHGQYTGFILCNTKDEIEKQKNDIEGIFKELKRNSLWIIVGYSGENDAIAHLLASEDVFENRLYWIGYKDNNPAEFVSNHILGEHRYGFYISGYDADMFFIELCQRLDCYPPEIVDKPFTFLDSLVNSVSEINVCDDNPFISKECANNITKNMIGHAIKIFESDAVFMADYYYNLGLTEKFFSQYALAKGKQRQFIVEKYKEKMEDMFKNALDFIEKFNSWDDMLQVKQLINAYDIVIKRYDNDSDNDSDNGEVVKYINDSIITAERAMECFEYDRYIYNCWSYGILSLYQYEENINKKELLLKDALEKCKKISEKDEDKIHIDIESIYIYLCYINLYIEVSNEEGVKEYLAKALEVIKITYNNKEIKPSYMEDVLKLWGEVLLQGRAYCHFSKEDTLKEANSKFEQAFNLRKSDEALMDWIEFLYDICYLDDIDENIKSSYINLAIYKYIEYIKVENDIAFFLDFIDKFYILEQNMNLLLCLEGLESAVDLFDNVMAMEKNEYDKLFILNKINSIAYTLIENNELEISKKYLDFAERLGGSILILATTGFYNFRLCNQSIENSLKFGKEYYERAIEKSINENENEDFQKALNQKYNYEIALFYYNRVNDIQSADSFCNKAIDMGRIPDFELNYDCCISLRDKINEKVEFKDIIKETATTKVSIDGD